MKSKSFNSNTSAVTLKQNRSFDFVNLYKSATETSASISERHKSSDGNDTESSNVKSESIKREKLPKRKKEKRETIDISQITIDGPRLTNTAGGSTPLNESKVTSTPLSNRKHQVKSSKVKSIMKSSLGVTDDDMDGSKVDVSTTKPKKRNKSVSFMLEDGEEVIIKKTKSDNSSSETRNEIASPKVKVIKEKKQFKKVKKTQLAEKENKVDVNQTMDLEDSIKEKAYKKLKIKHDKPRSLETAPVEPTADSQDSSSKIVTEIKKKRKKVKRVKKPIENTESKESTATESTSQESSEKAKKPKKKKHQEKPQTECDNEEPASKSRKTDSKPDVVAELENLSIGDNAHTLTNLLDEMTVVDKEKRKKLKQKFNKKPKSAASTGDTEKAEDVQEKVKWRRRKWNKDTKADAKDGSLDTVIIVENLPLSLLFSYKKVLAEHFVKYGLIKSVGIAEVYPTEESNPVFTTTINFYSDGAASQALEEDNTLFEGSRIRVKQSLPPTDTTLVVRSYGLLTAQSISSTFNGAGRIRNIRHSVKGKHAMATFFVEFDGPESVERAMKLATNVKIGGKRIYVSKFEVRVKKTKLEKTNNNEGSDADQSEDSQD